MKRLLQSTDGNVFVLCVIGALFGVALLIGGVIAKGIIGIFLGALGVIIALYCLALAGLLFIAYQKLG